MPKKTLKEQETAEPTDFQKEMDKLAKRDWKSLVDQIKAERELAWWFMKPKLDEWAVRLKLYNNQKRDKEAIGDPLLFTIHQTVLASLYTDRLNVEFAGRDEGDAEIAENLNALAVFDYDEMGKDELDYAWDWDASFFGRGLMLNMEFDRKRKCPAPEVIDMATWLRDPRATSVNGDMKGRGGMRFGGREIRLSKLEMDQAGIYFNYKDVKPSPFDLHSLIDQNAMARMTAQGLGDYSKIDQLTGDNADCKALEWFTHWKGRKVLVTLADDNKRVIRYSELPRRAWPIVDRAIYPIAHDWDGVSIPDLIEDKQRARAAVQNLGLKSIKIGLHPVMLYDTNKIKNRGNLNVDFNKHVGVEGNPAGAVVPLERAQVKAEVNWILQVLDTAAQKATATPDIQQGTQSGEKRTLGELELVSSKVDTRYSLSAKIFGWSEKRFYNGYYQLYKENFEDDIDEKVVRISGALGSKWRKLTRANIIAETDPDIKIESRAVSESVKYNELQKYRLWLKDIIAVDPQNSMIRSGLRQIGRLSGFSREEINQVLPPTIDELKAEKENESLSEGRIAQVDVTDDDFVHMEVHNKAADTPAKAAHIEAHKRAMTLKRVKPQFDMAGNRPENPAAPMPSPMPNFMPAGAPSSPGARPMPNFAQ